MEMHRNARRMILNVAATWDVQMHRNVARMAASKSAEIQDQKSSIQDNVRSSTADYQNVSPTTGGNADTTVTAEKWKNAAKHTVKAISAQGQCL
jgi:F0F1-type ATP synthase membrane subunit b/b'